MPGIPGKEQRNKDILYRMLKHIKNKWLGLTLILLVMCNITYFFLSFLLWDFYWITDDNHYGQLARALYVVITYIHICSKQGGDFMVKLAKLIKG